MAVDERFSDNFIGKIKRTKSKPRRKATGKATTKVDIKKIVLR